MSQSQDTSPKTTNSGQALLPAQEREYWRSLDELADTPEFREFLGDEFPGELEIPDGMSRRKFLSLMGASLAFAGLAGCRRPVEKIIPYVHAPENVVLGNPNYYASVTPFGLDSYGVIAENHEGRPTKLEGNPDHPASRGKSNALLQSEILNLYDPDRSPSPLIHGEAATWENFQAAWASLHKEFLASGGEGLAILSDQFTSPSLRRLKTLFKASFPNARWVVWEPVNEENIFKGWKAAVGKEIQPIYRMNKAQTIVALDADFLGTDRDVIRHTLDFAEGRRVTSEKEAMNRLYVAESSMTITGGMADHRYRLQAREIGAFAAALARELSALGVDIPGLSSLSFDQHHDFDSQWLKTVAEDLLKNAGKSLVLAGRKQPPAVHTLVAAINAGLNNIGQTVDLYPLRDLGVSNSDDFQSLIQSMGKGEISSLIMLGGNPVFHAGQHFSRALTNVEHTIHLSDRVDETSSRVKWHLPEAHFLESWGDAETPEGNPGIVQPQIQPLFDSKSKLEFLSLITTGPLQSGHDLVKETWQQILGSDGISATWDTVLHDGVLSGASLSPVTVTVSDRRVQSVFEQHAFHTDRASVKSPELVFQVSPSVYDGRYANVGWLQELPDPVTKLTWDNAAIISRTTANDWGIKNQEIIKIKSGNQSLTLPVWIMPGQADNSMTLELGYGRTHAGRIGNGVGSDVYKLRPSSSTWFTDKVTIHPTGKIVNLASTQDHHGLDREKLAAETIQDRLPEIIREATLEEYQNDPHFVEERVEHPPLKSMWEEFPYESSPQWGMSIDLNVCTGCNACTIACQSENNIPIVGKGQVEKGREMHWMRMDRYYTGDFDDPEMVYQPVACQHCETAPCEQVCPVAATTHSEDGLNGMTYNRCVGTRYCANNCPYKVRRFNFYNFTKDIPEIVEMAMNPEVTVRFRGVMEKCTFCVQRLSRVKIDAKNEDRPIRDGEVATACEQTCPADAIVFGDISDPESRVSRIKQQNRDYALLGELNTKPRTSYLAKIRNPHPNLESPAHEPRTHS